MGSLNYGNYHLGMLVSRPVSIVVTVEGRGLGPNILIQGVRGRSIIL